MTKKYDIIHLNGFIYAVDRNIKVGDTCRHKHPLHEDFDFTELHIIKDLHHSDYKPYEVRTNNGYGPKESYFKIVATNDPSLGLPLLPEIREDIEDIIDMAGRWVDIEKIIEMDAHYAMRGYVEGYKAASAKKYTEKDIKKAFRAGKHRGSWNSHGYAKLPPSEEEFIQSLNFLPIAVEIECFENDNPFLGFFVDENNFVKAKWIYEKNKKLVEEFKR